MKYVKRGGVKVLAQPFADVHELIKAASKNNRLKFNMALAFSEPVFNGIDGLNDRADEACLGDNVKGSLADIRYRVVGHVTGNSNQCSGLVVVEVDADASDVIDENLDAEAVNA